MSAAEANLAAGTALAVYRVAFEQWLTAAEDEDLRDVIRASMARLRVLVAATG